MNTIEDVTIKIPIDIERERERCAGICESMVDEMSEILDDMPMAKHQVAFCLLLAAVKIRSK